MRTSVNKGKCCACVRSCKHLGKRHKTSLSMNPPINSHSTETEKRETILPHPELKKDGSSILLSLSLSLSLSTILHSLVSPRRVLPLSLIVCCKGIVPVLHPDTHSISPVTYHFLHHEGRSLIQLAHLVISHVPHHQQTVTDTILTLYDFYFRFIWVYRLIFKMDGLMGAKYVIFLCITHFVI